MNNLLGAITPVVHNGVVFAGSSDGNIIAIDIETGEEIWTRALNSTSLGFSNYMVASPVVADGLVYAVSGDGFVFAIDESSGKVKWNHKIEDGALLNFVVSSPIIADGFLYISSITGIGRNLYCIGDFYYSFKARVVSNIIEIPSGYWWDRFNANYNATKGKITFSILNENGKIMVSGLNGTKNDISNKIITSSKIRLCAELSANSTHNSSELYSWSVSWKEEKTKPVFDEESFKPNPAGWISTNTPVCEILASDDKSGIDTKSAECQIQYKPKDSTSTWSNRVKVNCVKEGNNYRLTADIGKLFSGLNIEKLLNIKFFVKDLSGNEANPFSLPNGFKIDATAPTSSIKNSNKLNKQNINDDPLILEMDAKDSDSGVEKITLWYQYREYDDKKWSDWEDYTELYDPAEYSFIFPDIQGSGCYRICTVATDKAGNEEPFKAEKDLVSFTYDRIKPKIDTTFEYGYTIEQLSDLEIDFSDYALKSISYMPNNKAEWIPIEERYIEKTDKTKWTVKSDFWKDITDLYEIEYVMFNVTDSCDNSYATSQGEAVHILNTTEEAAEIYLDLSDFSKFQWDDKFTIYADIPDSIDIKHVTLLYKYSENKDDLAGKKQKQYGEKISNGPFEWEFKAEDGNGYYEFQIKVLTKEGKNYTSQAEIVTVSTFPLIPVILFIILLIVLIVLTAFILVRKKKKKLNA